jgi:hypothetical protein
MQTAIKQRLELVRDMAERPWFRAILLFWAVLGTWDLAVSQLVPESLGKEAPKFYQVLIWLLTMTSGWIPLWGWLAIGAALLVIGSLEFAFRATREERLKQRYLQPLKKPDGDMLDWLVDGQQAMEDLTKAVTRIGNETRRFANGISKFGSRLPYITNFKLRRRYLSKTARFINSYSEKVQNTANFMGSVMPVIAENQIKFINGNPGTEGLENLAKVVGETATNVLKQTIVQLQGMRKSADGIKGISGDLNVASERLQMVMGDLIQKVEDFGAVSERIQTAALTKLAASKSP